jgi:4-amino-4-deoxy-L-arabinose transferase-like glycosyltransferase
MIPAGKHPTEVDSRRNLAPALVLVAALVVRLYEAWAYFLNPDEALHNLLASQVSLGLSYKAALTNAHPPLLILVLYYWRALGHSELMLRLPLVLAGTAFCWIGYRWLKLVTDRSTAFLGLLLLAFSPALIELSAEVRQYALLLFFMSVCLYCSERAIRENSSLWMVLFSLSLCGALLSHYSSFIFAATLAVHMLVRLYPFRDRVRLVAVWGAGQVVAVALALYYLFTHVAELKRRGMAQGIAETWLKKSIFHPGENHVLPFIGAQTLRVFTYLLSHGVGGTLALIAFLIGILVLLKRKRAPGGERPSPRELALLLGIPFILNCSAALAGFYPYGGTRHNSFLAIFALSGTAIGLSVWKPAREWVKPLIVILCLAVCNFFPAPPPLIRARNHHRVLMEQTMNSLRESAPSGSLILADHESGLLFGYYACGHGVVQIFPPFVPLAQAECGVYTVFTPPPDKWKYYADDVSGELADMAATYHVAAGTKVWLFDAGWIVDSTPALRKQLQQLGCSPPHSFGENILLSQCTVGD